MRASRRSVLALLGSASVLALAGFGAARAQPGPGVQLLILSDLHSAYDRTGPLLAMMAAQVEASPLPTLILVNGDVFESGNVVASRSSGEIDWAFLAGLAALAPTVLNIGNHEPDFDPDLAHLVTRAGALGITVLSNITDTRSGQPYAQAGARLNIGGLVVSIAALGTPAMATYPKATRDMIAVPDPAEWAARNLPELLTGDTNIVLSHAGVVADRNFIDDLPDGTLLIGGHDHLILQHAQGATRYVHTGSWAGLLTVAVMTGGGQPAEIRQLPVDQAGPVADSLRDLIPQVMAAHLTEAERSPIATLPAAMSLAELARLTARTMAQATGADVGFIGHTSFGTGLPGGAVSAYAYDAALRFDGSLMRATVDAGTMAAIMARCNQDGDMPLDRRTGDFLYAAPDPVPGKATYTIVCNDWSAKNSAKYFGREDIAFTELPDVRLKPLIAEAL
ncbi:MAG: metallophosphoesterase [Paracoccus sp. (in: a-proteobacteria)]|uniref:metallophosphoesterase n=1 Tax=Paracoccus sp. TaxID=267 RepID=UPI0026DF9904|nr:metallophosphoesterase [Paracoccus sp. (in: a-proteobacteria)]MDO5620353.1 metallophosphoesterase [Paracoccus sp. (in: a-proteobacteria)]